MIFTPQCEAAEVKWLCANTTGPFWGALIMQDQTCVSCCKTQCSTLALKSNQDLGVDFKCLPTSPSATAPLLYTQSMLCFFLNKQGSAYIVCYARITRIVCNFLKANSCNMHMCFLLCQYCPCTNLFVHKLSKLNQTAIFHQERKNKTTNNKNRNLKMTEMVLKVTHNSFF